MNKIHFADVLPGTGKTHWALKRILQVINDKSGVVVYAAPTMRLLDEMRNGIRKALGAEMSDAKAARHIVTVDSRDYKVAGVGVGRYLEGVLDGRVLSDRSLVAKIPDGSVVLCSHDAVLSLSRLTSRKDKTDLIFDEARKCTLADVSITLPERFVDEVLEEFTYVVPIPDSLFSKVMPFESNFESSARLKSLLDGLPRKYKLASEKLVNTLAKATRANNELYLKRRPKSVTVNYNTDTLTLQLISVPHVALSGWNSTTLLSAFFTCSQLYHILTMRTRQDKNNRPALELIDISDEVINPKRHTLMQKRYEALSVTYVTDGKFNMSLLRNGVLVSPDDTQQADRLAAALKRFNDNNKKHGYKARTLRKLVFQAVIEKAADAVEALKGCDFVEHINFTPLTYMAKVAHKLHSKWVQKQAATDLPLLVSTNVGTRIDNLPQYWVREIVPYFEKGQLELVPFKCQGLNAYKKHDTLAFLATINARPVVVELFKALCPNYDANLDHTVEQAVQTSMRISVRDTTSSSKPLVIVPTKTLAEQIINQLKGMPTLVDPQSIARFPKYQFFNPKRQAVENVAELNRQNFSRYYKRTRGMSAYLLEHGVYHKQCRDLRDRRNYLKRAGKPIPPKLELEIKLTAAKARVERAELRAHYRQLMTKEQANGRSA